jgi:hypothetical protein
MMDTFDLKKRAYIGTTSMESEVSLLMANQALASSGKLVYDPFGSHPLLVRLVEVAHLPFAQLGRARCSSQAQLSVLFHSEAT